MVTIRLTAVTRTQGNNAALKDGSVPTGRFSLAFEEVPVLVRAFRRMVRSLEFDVCEMALTTYVCAKAYGTPFTALPIFLVRGFHHGAIVHHTGSGIEVPRDLEGRRVGVNRGYTVTTGVWARGILQEEYGVDLDKVTWVRSGDEHVAAYRPPGNVVSMEPGDTLEDLVATGALPAAVGADIDRPGVAPLIADPEAAGYAALRDRDFYPINHLVVVRDELLDEHPDLAVCLFDAFTESKRRYVAALAATTADGLAPVDRMHRTVMEITDSDPLPYGIAPNRTMLERLVGYAVSQHILDSPVPVESLFAAGTHDLIG